MLKLVLPKGSLERATFELFDDADLAVRRSSSVDYRASIDDPRVDEVRILRPQEIPTYVEAGLFDVGITGLDWVTETNSDVVSLGNLDYSKNTANPVSIVVAVAQDSPVQKTGDLTDGVRVATEFPHLAQRFFKENGVDAKVMLSYGATEAKVPEIADAVVELTETGRALRAAGLRIIDTILVSNTQFIVNKQSADNPEKFHAASQLFTLLQGSLQARRNVLVKLNTSDGDVNRIIELLPALKAPTVAQLWNGQGYAIETVVAKSEINTLLPALKDAGATDIIELPLRKILL